MKIEGTYAHRFSGFANSAGMPCHLVGLGSMIVDCDGNISGTQTSSTTRLKGSAALIEVGMFELEGNLLGDPAARSGPREAQITFTKIGGNDNGPKQQVLKARFAFVPCGSPEEPAARLWLISTGARNETEDADADEVVSGEAVRIARADD